MTEPRRGDGQSAEPADTIEPTHVVTGPLAIVPTANGQQVYVYEGGYLPVDTPDDAIEHLVSAGLVTHVDDLGERSGGDVEVAATERPLPGESKARWVDYVVSRGMDRSAAESMTKGELIDAYPAE